MSILSDTMRMGASQPSADAAYQIEKSIRFNDDDTPSFSRTLSLGNRRTHTIAMWIKIGEAGNEGYLFSAPSTSRIKLETDGTIKWEIGSSQRRITSQVFKDHAGWQHHVFALDTPNTNAASRARWYVNGKEITSFATADTITQNFESNFNSAGSHRIGANASNANNWDGYIADVQFIDGLALSSAAFGSFDDAGNWNPKTFALPTPNAGTTWSGQVSGSFNGSFTADNAFDGKIGGTWCIPANGTDLTWTTSITANTQIRIWINKNGTGGTLTQNGTDLTSGLTSGDQWVYLPSKTLTALVWGSNSANNQIQLMAVEVDGIILVDGRSDPDTRNNPNNGTTWSDQVTGTEHPAGAIQPPSAFDGSISSYAAPSGGSSHTWTPSGGMGVNKSLRLYARREQSNDNITVTFTDSSTFNSFTADNTARWYDITGASGKTIQTIVWSHPSSVSSSSLYAVEVDGHILVDGAGDNSFHLKFNNASDLGEDSLNSNDFTVNNILAADEDVLQIPSSEVTGSGSALTSNMFDNSLSTQVSSSDGGRVYWTPGSNITINTNGLKAYWSSTYTDYKNAIESDDGTNQIITITSGNANSWVTFSSYNGETIGPSNKLMFRSYRANDSDPGVLGFKAIEVNGKIVSINPGGKADIFNDTPTNYEDDSSNVHGNFCTANPLQSSSNVGFSEGNLELDGEPSGWYGCGSTMAVQTGLWYWEATAKKDSSGDLNAISIGITDETFTSSINVGYSTGSYGYSQANGNKQNNSSQTSYGTAAVENDVISVAFDANNGKLWFGKNNTWFASGNPATGANAAFTSIPSKLYTPMFSFDRGKWLVNFGAAGFTYTPPTGFKSLCTQNLDNFNTNNNPSKYFDVLTWTGDGGASRAVTGLGFQPDLSWIKRRNSSLDHFMWDAVRGVTKEIYPNQGYAEGTATNKLASFDSGGITVKNNSGVNSDGDTYVGWFWDAGTAANSSVTSCSQTVNGQWTNTTAGFSITSWEGGGGAGQTVAHGLGAKPDFFASKRIDGSQNWICYHSALGAEYMITLDASDAKEDRTQAFNDTEPTNTLITYGSESRVGNTDTHITYAWTAIPGFSAFGSYEATGSSGLFVHLGFKPAFLMIKGADHTSSWNIRDNKRDSSNPNEAHLVANGYAAESTQEDIDFVSNGFVVRSTDAGYNSSNTFIYCAWAEHPFKTSRAN